MGVDIDKLHKEGKAFVKWDILHLCTGDNIEDEKSWIQIEPELQASDFDFKRPTETSIEESEQVHTCKTCNETMDHERCLDGKMCCDKPMFGDDHEDEDDFDTFLSKFPKDFVDSCLEDIPDDWGTQQWIQHRWDALTKMKLTSSL